MAYSLDTKIVLPLGTLALLIIYVIYYLYNRNKQNGYELVKQNRVKFIFCFYILIMISFTLLPVLIPPIESQPIEYNLDISYLFSVLYDRAHLISIAGNALLFAPVVIIGRISKFKCFKTLICSIVTLCCISLIIELLQGLETYLGMVDPASINIVDINDVITNTIGGIIGWVLIEMYRKNCNVRCNT